MSASAADYVPLGGARHRHGDGIEHAHPHSGPHTHAHPHQHGHGHSHGLLDRSIMRSRAGLRAVGWSLAVLGLTALAQLAIYLGTGSVALLSDLVHNAGDALTAVPVGIAFLMRSARAERWAGMAVVLAILASALVAAYESIDRLIHPQDLTGLWILAAAGVIGFAGNEIAARGRLREPRGRRERGRGGAGHRGRGSAHRARHRPRHPEDHLGLVAHGAGGAGRLTAPPGHPKRRPRRSSRDGLYTPPMYVSVVA